MVSVKAENKAIAKVVKGPKSTIASTTRTMVSVKVENKVIAKVTKGPKSTIEPVCWKERYSECKEFRKNNNHCKIPTNFKENKSLGIWVQEQRRNFKKQMKGEKPRKELTQEQIEMLDEIGFHWGFTPDPNKSLEPDASWEKNFAKLQEYKKAHGDFDVPMDDAAYSKLGKWTRVQRSQKNLRDTKRKCFIKPDRIKKLDGIGFNWKGPRKIDV